MAQLAVDDSVGPALAAVLRKYWGFDQLRPLQQEAIAAALSGRDSLVVLPTGGGKSLCYQAPAAVAGRTDIVVSPLISLMKDQVDALQAAGYPAAALHSGMNDEERSRVLREMLNGSLRLVFVAPERLLTSSFLAAARRADVRAFHIDEAHCISQWGHDFRPEYRRLRELRRAFPQASIHAYTATATPRVRGDIAVQLGLRGPAVLVGRFDRPNLDYRIVRREDPARQVLETLGRHPGEAVIVYCISRKETEEMAAFLRSQGIKAGAYHAGMTAVERTRTQEAFAAEELDVVVATVAFGMGIDRSNVRCVIHAAMPKSIEHYQQETGRAGRDGLEAECVMLFSPADSNRWSFILGQSESSPEVLQAQRALVRDMRNFCESPVCRHVALSRYFGQTLETENCGACDVCRPGEAEAAAGESGWAGVDRDLFEQLRLLRRKIAEERDVPAYVVFSDATLREIARVRPGGLVEMKRVKGVGDRKLADLGKRFVAAVRAYCAANGVSMNVFPADQRAPRPAAGQA
ncbi:MAG TPA: ATP-dependent DNA helicase RecQ, partial [Dehalococcoidia bacterium]|nr:ATP-dependent DNA helicase RecQ [Dehalococcoidia bacterium]